MALTNTKRSVLLITSGGVLPTSADAIEVTEEFVPNGGAESQEFNRITGQLGAMESYNDPNTAKFDNQTFQVMLRTSDKGQTAFATPPFYGKVLKVCGLLETIDTGTAGQETVIYSNNQSPEVGSLIAYTDDKKWTSTGSIVGDASFTFTAGSAGMMEFGLSGFLDNQGIPVDETNPVITPNMEDLVVITKNDTISAGGTLAKAEEIRLSMNAQIEEFYGVSGLKEYNIVDYTVRIEADYFVDKGTFADDQQKVIDQVVEAIEIKLGTDSSGNLVNGKSIKITAPLAKASSISDSVEKSKVKRTMSWLVQNNGSGESFQMQHGFFA